MRKLVFLSSEKKKERVVLFFMKDRLIKMFFLLRKCAKKLILFLRNVPNPALVLSIPVHIFSRCQKAISQQVWSCKEIGLALIICQKKKNEIRDAKKIVFCKLCDAFRLNLDDLNK